MKVYIDSYIILYSKLFTTTHLHHFQKSQARYRFILLNINLYNKANKVARYIISASSTRITKNKFLMRLG